MNYADLAPIVAIDAMGAPEPLIVRKIAETANEFFRLTRAYEFDSNPAIITANTKLIGLTLPADTVLCEIVEVRLGPDKVWPRADRQLQNEFGLWENAEGTPRYYKVIGGQVRVVPFPTSNTTDQLRIKASIAPTVTAESMADEPGLRYQDALINGAKARVLAMPKKAWTDPATAGIFQQEYATRLNEVRLLARNGGSSEASIRVRPRFK